MKFLFDGTPFGDRPSGVRTRVLGLGGALQRRGHGVLVATATDFQPLPDESWEGIARCPTGVGPAGRMARWASQGRVLERLRRASGADLLVADALPWPRSAHLWGVVHDLRHVRNGGLTGWLARTALRSGIRRARVTHVVSRCVQAELSAVTRRPTIVVPNGVDLVRWSGRCGPDDEEVLRALDLVPGFILWVGHREHRKGPDLAVRVHQRLMAEQEAPTLVLVGRGSEPLEGEGVPTGESPRRIRVLPEVSDRQLSILLRGAGCLLASARYEGFGLVPLQALACGCPVVASDIPAHREVLGDLPWYAASNDLDALTAAVRAVLSGPRRDEQWVVRAVERARCWSWDQAAEAFLAG